MIEPLEGDLATVTDQEWLEAHAALSDLGVFPDDELSFAWEPEEESRG